MQQLVKEHSQENKVLGHLLAFGKITPGEAMAQYGVHRLAARVHNLRRAGVHVVTRRVERGDKRFALYVLNKR